MINYYADPENIIKNSILQASKKAIKTHHAIILNKSNFIAILKTNMININHKMYKCHFCQENIDVYGIDKHFAIFHKFRHSSESEYVCEFCDD